MRSLLNPNAQKVQDSLNAFGVTCQVIEMPSSTRSAQEAAQAVGCQVGQIVKSLIFRGKQTQAPYLLLVSGANRVNEKLLSEVLGEKIEKPDADYVREISGFVIGGVAPLGHTHPMTTFIDEDLLNYSEIWAAAGTPNAVFRLTPTDLLKITAGKVIALQ